MSKQDKLRCWRCGTKEIKHEQSRIGATGKMHFNLRTPNTRRYTVYQIYLCEDCARDFLSSINITIDEVSGDFVRELPKDKRQG